MFKIKPLLSLSFLLFSTINYAQFTDVINSNRPGESMAAFSVGKTVFQVEDGLYGFHEKYSEHDYKADAWGNDLSIRYGAIFEQLEFILNMKYQNEQFISDGFGDSHNIGIKKFNVGAKFLLYDPDKNYERKPNLYSWKANHKFNFRQFIPAIGVYGGVNYNFGSNTFARPFIPKDDKISLKGMILTQNQFGRYTFLTNIIIDRFPSAKKTIDYVATLTRGFNERWSGMLEVQSNNGDHNGDTYLRVGAAFLAYENIQFDASIGKNFKDTPSMTYGGVGVAWRFDDNYSEIKLRVPKEEKGKDDKKGKKDKKNKDKDKSNKRLDAVSPEGDGGKTK